MGERQRIWLVDNASSGSNDQEALRLLEETCGEAGFHVAYRTHFPRYDLPSPAMLDAAGIGIVAVFAGDGTINAAINNLAGWSGAVLVLPGGTMNLLYHRLHGQRRMYDVVCAAAAGHCHHVRPSIVRCGELRALAGLMAGPGTSWNLVRESLRENAILELAEHTIKAIESTLGGAMITVSEPRMGRERGYPLILLNPEDDGIEVLAYHAEGAREYLEQTFALLKRDFREGPHDDLGRVRRVVLASTDGRPFGLLVDGEPAPAEGTQTTFELAACEVDLLATEAPPLGGTQASIEAGADAEPGPHG